MKPTKIVPALLLFAAINLAFAGEKPAPQPAAAAALGTNATSQVVAYYFHGTVRCETCLKIEKQAREIIERRFAAELATNRLVFKPLNYDLKENSHFLRDYKLPFPSLVLVRQENGKDMKWKMLGETWTLVEDPAAFDQYLEKEISVYLDQSGKAAGGDVTNNTIAKEPISDSTPGTRVDSLADMNARFGDVNAAFVFVHATNGTSMINWVPINRARRTMEGDWGIKVGLFELKPSPSDYDRLALRLPAFRLPTVMVVLQNGTTTMVSGGLSETNLVQEFIYAVSAAGCCPFGEH